MRHRPGVRSSGMLLNLLNNHPIPANDVLRLTLLVKKRKAMDELEILCGTRQEALAMYATFSKEYA